MDSRDVACRATLVGSGCFAMTVSAGSNFKLLQEGGFGVALDGRIKGLERFKRRQGRRDEDIRRLLGAWRIEGARCLQQVRGDFAISLWEQQTQRLHLI